MVLSKRERIVFIATLAVLGIFAADYLVISPVLARRAKLDELTARTQAERDTADALIARQARLAPMWRAMLDAGLALGPDDAQSLVLNAVQQWSQNAGMLLDSLRPERSAERDGLEEIGFRYSGKGRMSAVSNFLWRFESAGMPIRISTMELRSLREGLDDLSLEIRFSALCHPAGSSRAPAGADVPLAEATQP